MPMSATWNSMPNIIPISRRYRVRSFSGNGRMASGKASSGVADVWCELNMGTMCGFRRCQCLKPQWPGIAHRHSKKYLKRGSESRYFTQSVVEAIHCTLHFFFGHMAHHLTGSPVWTAGTERVYYTLLIGGGVHRPSSTSALGAYSRIIMVKSPVGAGSQLDSLSSPGDSCWK